MHLKIASAAEASGEDVSLLRPLGAFERMHFHFEQRHTMHFMVAAEFRAVLTEEQLRRALRSVQDRHPLLGAFVRHAPTGSPTDSRTDSRTEELAFCRPSPVPEVGLRVVTGDHRDWQPPAADEFRHKFDAAQAPLMRATLVTGDVGSTVILTFSHVIADGMSAVFVLEDLVAALNGTQLPPLPVPPSQEEMIAKNLPAIDPSALAGLPAPDPRMTPLITFEPLGKRVPRIHTRTLGREFTDMVVTRCRAEDTTVQGLLVAAFAQVLGDRQAEHFVRVVTPINIRATIGIEKDCANYISSARTGSDPQDSATVWDRARAVTTDLGVPRSPAGVAIGSMAVQHFLPAGVDGATVEHFMNTQLGHELQVSNLGVLDLDRSGQIHPTAVWGPMLLLHVSGEINSGITTFDGRLRIVTSSRVADDDFLEDVQRVLEAALTED